MEHVGLLQLVQFVTADGPCSSRFLWTPAGSSSWVIETYQKSMMGRPMDQPGPMMGEHFSSSPTPLRQHHTAYGPTQQLTLQKGSLRGDLWISTSYNFSQLLTSCKMGLQWLWFTQIAACHCIFQVRICRVSVVGFWSGWVPQGLVVVGRLLDRHSMLRSGVQNLCVLEVFWFSTIPWTSTVGAMKLFNLSNVGPVSLWSQVGGRPSCLTTFDHYCGILSPTINRHQPTITMVPNSGRSQPFRVLKVRTYGRGDSRPRWVWRLGPDGVIRESSRARLPKVVILRMLGGGTQGVHGWNPNGLLLPNHCYDNV